MANTEALQSEGDGVAADVELFVPENDVDAPELSIVIPALDEELTIETFVRWCKEGISRAGVAAEILIVDSSTDRTTEIGRASCRERV